MRCKNRVLVSTRVRAGEAKEYVKEYRTLLAPESYPLPESKDGERVEECGGQVRVFIRSEASGCCCSGGSVEVEAACKRCGCQSYPELLEFRDDAEAMLTAYVSAMTDEEYLRRVEAHKAAKAAQDAKHAAWQKRWAKK
jgi:hypothetical protein